MVKELAPLDDPAALKLLAAYVGEQRVAAEPGAAAAIVRWCAGLPVRLRAVGGHLVKRKRRSLAETVALLDDTQERSRLAASGQYAARRGS